MESLQQHTELLVSIADEWDIAEETIKLAELVVYEPVFPSIKELRYGGRRVIDGLNAINSLAPMARVTAFFEDARFCCYRARHDAIDATIATIALELRAFTNKIGFEPVLQAFPQYPQLLKMLDDTQKRIAYSRRRRNDRNAVYSTVNDTRFIEIIDLFQLFRVPDPIIEYLTQL